ncbi:MAG TPA: helix-turn-helix domain-containing protein [Acidimicrobiales bacterium]|nr:helix-turn-helix domain-containing protein [Acidimicrobiales bacterium]
MATTIPDVAAEVRLSADRFSPTQQRTIDAAMDLFGDHGVSGTSLQMVADALGVTKAAVYHQFKSKDSLVLAVAEVGMAPLQDAIVAAEAEPSRVQGRAVLLTRVIDLAVERRRWVHALQGDPVIVRLLTSHEPLLDLVTRVYSLLLDNEADPGGQVRAAIVAAAIGGAIVNPLVARLDDATLRAELIEVTRRLFELPD